MKKLKSLEGIHELTVGEMGKATKTKYNQDGTVLEEYTLGDQQLTCGDYTYSRDITIIIRDFVYACGEKLYQNELKEN